MKIVPLLAAFALALLPACGGSQSGSIIAVTAGPMEELSEVYKYIAVHKGKVPGKLDDLVEFEPSLPTAWPAIQNGDIVVFWGNGQLAASKEVLAYEKKAAESGGKVLLRDGEVRAMTAAEFNAAPKAKK